MRKIAVVTGGGGGMGLATAKILGRENIVIICDLHTGRLEAGLRELKSLGIEGEAVTCDITVRSSVQALMAQARKMGNVQSVVHTAGVSPHMGDAKKIMAINALGTVHVNEAFFDIAQAGSCIVNVASMAGHMLPRFMFPRRSYRLALTNQQKFFRKMVGACNWVPAKMRPGIAYCISKNFVMWYSRSEAGRFGLKGARILSVSPGSFDTEMGRLEGESAARPVQHAAIKRFGNVEEMAELLAFCAGPKPGYLTGTDILCDGGTVAGMRLRNLMNDAKTVT